MPYLRLVRSSLALVVGVLLLAGCDSSIRFSDVAEVRDSLLAADRAFSQMSAEQGAQAAFVHYAHPEVVLLPARGEPVRGIAGVAAGFEGFEGTLTWDPQDAQGSASGDLGSTWGFYRLVRTAEDGSERISRGKYVSVWRRDQSGEWRYVLDIGNESAPLN
jgi:ketosteroid isomerase-like protein